MIKKFMFIISLTLLLSACSIETYLDQYANPDQSAEASETNVASEKAVSDQTDEKPAEVKDLFKSDQEQEVSWNPPKSLIPEHLEIPSIGLSAPVEKVGLTETGAMAVTDSFETTGWYEKGYKPGSQGNAVIGGHVDSYEGAAVFYDLQYLSIGDEVIVKDAEGQSLTFVVTEMVEYPWDAAPIEEIFGFTTDRSLNLITCTGDYDRDSNNYNQRLVVYTELKEA
ncbi:class F sortase [Jeotgalibacillus terrae]|uniref:Class F sortase n=1 Tax=Jeotgalibacillus terrae TaxID=587735 RepID=A0ABW5ZPL6_9BACL|nr:class F sortase [Jeotgalibacillus terrae]MBM7581059.1 LPXTG-site transpeptidase (sortase) family protein [Jeotgalibacillus terrae]